MQPHLIVFEGLDGTGKTTLARAVSILLNGIFLTTPCPRIRQVREDILASFGGSAEASHLFYMSTVFGTVTAIQALRELGVPVVVDRYFLSTQTYAAFQGSTLQLDHLNELLPPATLTVYVHALLAVRQSRIRARNASKADLVTLDPDATQRLQDEHEKRYKLPVVGSLLCIENNGNRSVDELAQEIAAHLTRSL